MTITLSLFQYERCHKGQIASHDVWGPAREEIFKIGSLGAEKKVIQICVLNVFFTSYHCTQKRHAGFQIKLKKDCAHETISRRNARRLEGFTN